MCENLSKENGGIDMFSKLPADCMATIISSTTPRDACQLATISKTFKSASNSDAVWLHFLPSNMSHILQSLDNDLSLFFTNKFHNAGDFKRTISKRELFFDLLFQRPPLLIDGGTKSVSLDRFTGNKCCSISASDLDITWGDTPKYWQRRSESESRFGEVAELISVCWFEIHGKVKASLLSQDTNYVAYFVFKTTDRTYGFNSPAEVSISIDGRKMKKQNVYLDEQEVENQRLIVPRRRRVFHHIQPHMTTFMLPAMKQRNGDAKIFPRKRDDGWLEVQVGEFFVPRRTGNRKDLEVEMSISEIDSGNWKGGLVVEGFDIRPKILINNL